MSEVAVLILTEDASKWAFETVEQVCRGIFDWLTPQIEAGDWLTFTPANDAARAAMTANMWKSKKARDQHKILRLCKNIAEHILRADGFVFFHFDGDGIWNQGKGENNERFEAVVRKKVRDLVRGHLSDDLRTEHVMNKLVHVSPHYSIETWLFANIAALRGLGVTDDILDEWERDLTLLDCALKPKDLLTSVSTRHYVTLARALKTAALYQLETSFCDTVHRAGACASLIVHLRAHWPAWVRRQYGLE